MQLAWVTDPHLEWQNDTLEAFIDALAQSETDGVVISGDISTSKHIKYHLKRFASLPMPVYFVLGNHDFYHSSFEHVRGMVRRSVRDHKNLTWLTVSKPVKLTEQTYLIGHDGWADGRAGMGQASGYLVNDYNAISDFRGLSVGSVFGLMQKMADSATSRLETQIRKIGAKHIIVVTHATPFVEAYSYIGRPLDEAFLPHFCNIGMGRMLTRVAEATGAWISVLCGHLHKEAHVHIDSRVAIRVRENSLQSDPYTVIDADLGC